MARTRPDRRGDRLSVAVLGCGYWGPNLIRNFALCPRARVAMICDPDREALERAGRLCGTAEAVTDAERCLAAPGVDAVVIATPVHTHVELALAALAAGKHVLVEKPLAPTRAGAEALVQAADERGLTLMVDHTFIYSPPARLMKELVDRGELGELYYVDSVRINLGLIQSDVNVVWDLGPHDLSLVDYLLERRPRSVSAIGSCHTGEGGVEDVAYLNLDYGEGLIANFHLNWLSPVKVRHFILGGSRKSLVYNHLDHAEPVKLYDRGVVVESEPRERHGALVNYRLGDVWTPHVPQTEALAGVAEHFAECVLEGKPPISDGRAGLRVVEVLEAAQRSIRAQGARVEL